MSLLISRVVIMSALFVVGISRASPPPDVTDAERRILPRYCFATQGFARDEADAEEYKRYVARYGETWTAMHHYCWALVDFMRFERASRSKPSDFADPSRTLGNLDYALRWSRSQPNFPLRPDILEHKVRLLIRIGRPDKAAETARQLMTEWPKIPEGYVLLADLLISAGKRDAALDILREADAKVEDREHYEKLKSIMQNRL